MIFFMFHIYKLHLDESLINPCIITCMHILKYESETNEIISQKKGRAYVAINLEEMYMVPCNNKYCLQIHDKEIV